MLDPRVHCLVHLLAEAGRSKCRGLTPHELAVNPRGRLCFDLRLQRQVGSHCECDPLLARRILEPAQLDDTAGRRISYRVEVGQAEMMHPAVHAIDDGINALLELVIEAVGDETANDPACIPVVEGEITNASLDPLLAEASVNPLDDVVTLSQRTQRELGTLGQPPSCWTERLNKTKPLELVQPPDHGRLQMTLPRSIGG